MAVEEIAVSQPLELPDPVYDALAAAASACGTTPVGWIVAHLPATKLTAPAGAKSMADVLRGRTGRIASDGQVAYSQNCGELFADGLEEKRREGRL
jgi:hypothetical protein